MPFRPPDEITPRRLDGWIREQLAADPGLDAQELRRREVEQLLGDDGYRPTADKPGLREKASP